ncbi:PTS mannose/fructose/sorbose transporter subunit IIB [Pediococcus acidilactici]|nr:PTS mannose/fructose/sorbose transporter subunit IIB [Pediococcus acidilactici]
MIYMPVVNVRVDARLIHGQVAAVWSSLLQVKRIIVANDEAETNEIERASLRMAAPSQIWLSVLNIKKAVTNIKNGRYGNQRVFLIFQNVLDAKKYVENGGIIKELTIGNISHKEGSKTLVKSISVNDEEVAAMKWLETKGTSVIVQTVPNDPKQDIKTLLK